MSSANNEKIVISSLDFDSIKANFIQYMQSQNTFLDFDFTGSAINQLIDILCLNTHYLSFYLNMAVNEAFLDTAVLKPNIISHAKLLSYTPRSMTASQATINVAITKSNGDSTTILTMPRFTAFTSQALNGVSYNFVTVDSATVSNTGNQFNFTGVQIKEGQPVVKTFVVDSTTNPTQSFDLADSSIDTSTLQVVVQTSNTNLSQNTFTLAENATEVTGDTNVYYIDIGQSSNYQIYFGDGILGTQLQDGNLVIVSYLSTSGTPANQIQTFKLQTALLSGSTANVTTVIPSSGGSDAESSASIKLNAPKSYLSQNRCVTVNDYINQISKRYPFFQSVTVWGGEKNIPPVYGKVFISALPLNGFTVTEAQKQVLINTVLQPIGVLTVIPQFVDADETFLNFRVDAFYDPKQTSSTATQMQSIVANSVISWANGNLNQFNNAFRQSKLLRAIDDSDLSITGSACNIFLQKRFDPILNTEVTYTLNFGIPLQVGSGQNRVYSSPTFEQTDQTGTLRQCFIEEVPLSSTGVESISVLTPGSGYTSVPTITILGDGTGANAFAIIVNGKIASVVVDQQGAEYTTATVEISGGGGSGALLEAITQQTTGTLRSYYFDQNNIKTVLSNNIGTIDYTNGILVLNDFTTSNVSNPSGTLSIYAPPSADNFASKLNNILTFDSGDVAAVTVNMNVDKS
jgi:hypothetical protein